MKTHWIAMAVMAFGCPFSMGQAEVRVEMDSLPPSENIEAIIDESSTNAGYTWRNDLSEGRRDIGQSFLASGSFDMDIFSLQIHGNIKSGIPGAVFTFTLYKSENPLFLGEPVARQTGTFPTHFIPGTGKDFWLTFYITPVRLIEGSHYTFVLSFDEIGSDRFLGFTRSSLGDDPYRSGRSWESVDGKEWTSSGLDYFFIVTGKNE